MLSMLSWQPAHTTSLRCWARICFCVPLTIPVGNGGTFAGGGGGGAQSNWLSTQAPRFTTEVRVGYEVTDNTPAIVRRPPPRCGVVKVVRTKPVPPGAATP